MDIVALSHLRWDFVYQRPQHLMSRAGQRHRVLFVEEPVDGPAGIADVRTVAPGVTVATPSVPVGWDEPIRSAWLEGRLFETVSEWRQEAELLVWHWDVMAEPLTRRLPADLLVFDCMDELSLFRDAPAALVQRERALMRRADLVFTGGHSLWEAKRAMHPSVHAFPSGVDLDHFAKARNGQPEPAALEGIPRPRLVYAGVIDERIDLPLLASLAEADAGEVVLIGPIAKIDEADVPAGPRIHRLGLQRYDDLPAFFANCDVGLMPFALNDATRFISPTKAPEYLAAGLPVVSTAIRDVVRGYVELEGTVAIASDPAAFAAACRRARDLRVTGEAVDGLLAGRSWDSTWSAMEDLIRARAADADAA